MCCVFHLLFPEDLPAALAALLGMLDKTQASLNANPWEHPPVAIVEGGKTAVREYFKAIYRRGTTRVTRPLKVVIVGKETVGKTRYASSSVLQICC